MRLASLLLLLLLPAPLLAQKTSAELLRSNPKFLHAFHDATATPSASVVRVLCDGKETAFGVALSADGWVLTKAYDLKGKITCKPRSGIEYAARLVGVHPLHDLALLQIDARGLTPIVWSESKGMKAGSWVAAVGTGEDPLAVGVVGVATRQVVVKGPLILDPAKAPYLGVALDSADEGVRVTQVMPNSAAAKAGLQIDDMILSLDGTKVTNPDDFVTQLTRHKIGDKLTLAVRRGGELKDVEATLQSRPASSARAELQNRMGSELSGRKTGYPTILQHDAVIKPTDCGSPLVDLQGRVLGLNISRAGRTESYAIPSEVITPLLPELRAGKFPPPPVEKVALSADAALDALLVAMRQRLLLMPEVARAKWNAQTLKRDGPREAEILDRLASAAKERGLDADELRRFFAAQIDASWLVQQAHFMAWQSAKQKPFDTPADLKASLRPRVDAASNELLAAYAAARPHLSAEYLRQRAPDLLAGDGITDAVRERALAPLLQR